MQEGREAELTRGSVVTVNFVPEASRLPQLAGRPMVTATWRANPDWGSQLGYSPADLARVNRDAITMLAGLRDRYGLADVVISGMVEIMVAISRLPGRPAGGCARPGGRTG